jgi:thymidine phosphorylase
VTATVESLPLITASILSKKRAAGLQALVMDVKCGSGAFCATRDGAQALARSLVEVARGAGLPTVALVTDMDRVLGRSAGNALEVAEALAVLRNDPLDEPVARLRELCLTLAAEALLLGGVCAAHDAARQAAERALGSGDAAERFARMVAAQGGPADVLVDARLPRAPVRRPVPAPRAGVVGDIDVKALGWAVVALGGGRRRPGDAVDPRVGLDGVRAPGEAVAAGEPLAWVHAADEPSADIAARAVLLAMPVEDAGEARQPAAPLVIDTLR